MDDRTTTPAGGRFVLALDIGGTKLAAAVVGEDGATHGLIVEPTRVEEGPDRILARLFAMGQAAIAGSGVVAGVARVEAVGISCGGPLDAERGVLERPLNLPGWIDIPIVEMAEAEFGVPVALENDASAAALGEYRYGSGRGLNAVAYLTISTGIGGGMVFNGKLYSGAAGNGGEPGHIVVRSGGRLCLCGRFGCLEAYASGTSIAIRAREAVASPRGADSALRSLDVVRAEDVSAAAAAGDPLATELWEETVEAIGIAVTDLVNVIEPDRVILGGGVTRAGDALLQPIREQVQREAMTSAARVVDVVLAGLGDSVSLVGAGAVAFDFVNDRNAEEVRNVAVDA